MTFGATATDPDGTTPLGDAWDFGGAAPASTEQNPTVTFATAGTDVVRMTATDANGLANPTPAQITLRVGAVRRNTDD